MTYVLGLDLGARSLGWALVGKEGEEERKLLGVGVRIFEAGVEGALELGREESRSVQRRMARLARRQTRRRRQRARQLYHALASAGFLPAVMHSPGRPEAIEIQKALNQLDCGLHRLHEGAAGVTQLPYYLRARALDQKLEKHELGRAIYHLGQRRGFQSNRRAKAKAADDEKGRVYGGIHELEALMQGKRTLGEFQAGLNPAERRIRGRYTHRKMYEAEFESIWAAQEPHHPELTPEFKDLLSKVLFYQRPLQDSSDLIGACEWAPEMRRTEMWRPEFQRFRILQTANHLRLRDPDGVLWNLSAEQRRKLIQALEGAKEVGLGKAKKLLSVPSNWKFTIEDGGETKLKGDAVAAQMRDKLGEGWAGADLARRVQILERIAAAATDEEVAAFLQGACALPAEEARQAAEEISLPAGYASLSLAALQRALPFMEEGMSVQEARMAAGFALTKESLVHDFLPSVQQAGLELRNPAVARALTETRKVVNAIIRQWGRPEEIHIEMARELKKSRDLRQKDVRTNRDREKERSSARERIEKETGLVRIGRKEIELALLYEECGGHCPYSGTPLGGLASILNGTAPVHVEHIVPRSISLDDSFANLTLATAKANAEKGNRTPREAFGSDETLFAEIIARVKLFQGPFAARKLSLFQLEDSGKDELLAKFSERHLNDTRYSSRLAAEYLGLLYGGELAGGKRNILKATGQVTADLRGLWRLNEILSGDSRKSREDHRHHAVDAAVLAVLGQKWIQRLSEAAESAWKEKKRRYASVAPPWIGFKEELKAAIEGMHISYRPNHRISGRLNKDSNYGYRGKDARGRDVVRIRVPVHKLGPKDLDQIVDQGVREAVRRKLSEVGDIAKLETNPPVLRNKNGAPVPIRKVRIEFVLSVRQVGKGHKTRYAEESETHHVEVCEVTQGGKRVWRADVVSMSAAHERLAAGKAVVDRSEAEGRGFLYSLCKDDTVELHDPQRGAGIWVVKQIKSDGRLALVPEHDARQAKGSKDDPQNRRVQLETTVSALRSRQMRKVIVDPLGRILEAHD